MRPMSTARAAPLIDALRGSFVVSGTGDTAAEGIAWIAPQGKKFPVLVRREFARNP